MGIPMADTSTYSLFQLSAQDTEGLIAGTVSAQALGAVQSALGFFPSVSSEIAISGGNTIDPPAGTSVLFDDQYNPGVTTIDEPNSMLIVAGAQPLDIQLNTSAAPGAQTLVLGNQGSAAGLTATADAGAATIFGGAGDNLLSAGASGGNHELVAGSGLSTLFAGSGVDSLVSGSGNATMTGGTGTTDFYLASGNSSIASGSSTITAGSSTPNGDQNVYIGNATSTNTITGNNTNTFVHFTGQSASDITATESSSGVVTITFDDTGQKDTLTGVTKIYDENNNVIHPT
jgi:Ca2+-binding RTX toxin-like protein